MLSSVVRQENASQGFGEPTSREELEYWLGRELAQSGKRQGVLELVVMGSDGLENLTPSRVRDILARTEQNLIRSKARLESEEAERKKRKGKG